MLYLGLRPFGSRPLWIFIAAEGASLVPARAKPFSSVAEARKAGALRILPIDMVDMADNRPLEAVLDDVRQLRAKVPERHGFQRKPSRRDMAEAASDAAALEE